MKNTLTTVLAGALSAVISLPAAASAQDMDSWVSTIIESAKAGNGTYIETSASASTGGQTVTAGERATTGDAGASARAHTSISADGSGGEVSVEVTTSRNGVVQTESYTKTFAPGETVDVRVATSAHSGEVRAQGRAEAHMQSENVPSPEPAAGSEQAQGEESGEREEVPVQDTTREQTASTPRSIFGSIVTMAIPEFFKRIFAFVWPF